MMINWIQRHIWPFTEFAKIRREMEFRRIRNQQDMDGLRKILERQRLANFIWIKEYKAGEPMRIPDRPPTIKLPELAERVRALEGQEGQDDTATGIRAIENKNGLTVAELKEAIKDWPETDQYGEPCEVWLGDGGSLSNEAVEIGPLNHRCEGGKEWADIILDIRGKE